MFNISKVVDDGSFHKVLENGVSRLLKLEYDIPAVCKINLDGQMPPLHLKIQTQEKK